MSINRSLLDQRAVRAVALQAAASQVHPPYVDLDHLAQRTIEMAEVYCRWIESDNHLNVTGIGDPEPVYLTKYPRGDFVGPDGIGHPEPQA